MKPEMSDIRDGLYTSIVNHNVLMDREAAWNGTQWSTNPWTDLHIDFKLTHPDPRRWAGFTMYRCEQQTKETDCMGLAGDLKHRNGKLFQHIGLKRTLLVASGTLCVILGIFGIFLPVLPTTPFLLLAAFCYARSSKRYYTWLMTNRWFGQYIRNYHEGRGISLKQKVFTILFMWVAIGHAAGFVVTLWWLKLILIGIAIGVAIHLISIKTLQPKEQNPLLPN